MTVVCSESAENPRFTAH